MALGQAMIRTVFLVALSYLAAACAAPVPTPTIAPVTDATAPGDVRPAAYPSRDAVQPLPESAVEMPRAGATNSFGVMVTPSLERAYDAYLGGDGPAALAALDAAEAEAGSGQPVRTFHLSALRAQVLIMMGRAAEAETRLDETARHERAAFGSDVNAVALRAEARLWLGDYGAAEADAKRVAAALQGWVLPDSFSGPPTNLPELYALTTAQLRAYTVLAGLYILQEEPDAALPWARAAERGYDTVHAVGAHPLYGLYLVPYADGYYGRAFNLLFLGASEAVKAGDAAAGADSFDRADAFFQTVGYRAGSVAGAALKAWTLYTLDARAPAIGQAGRAVQMATDAGFPDYVWRIEALRGELLLAEDRVAEAEAAFRRADAAVHQVSGDLATDRAKRRYGVGKQTLTYRLAQIDRRNGDLDALFRDLERGRARAFVDMLAGRPVAAGRAPDLTGEIRRIDKAIRRLRVINLAPQEGSAATRAEEARLLSERAETIARLRATDSELADVFAAEAAGIEAVAGALKPGETLAYMLPARPEDRLAFLVVTQNDAKIVPVEATAEALRRAIIRFREAVELRRPTRQKAMAEQLAATVKFSDWKGAAQTYVVPSGDLFFMPWGALPEPGPVVVLPTGGWVLRTVTGGGANVGAGVVGDPAFGGALPQLDGAREEARQVARLLATDPLTGAAATPEAVRSRTQAGANVLHIASHGLFDAADPLRSAIALSNGTDAQLVTAAKLFADPIVADLVVLSACETGMGKAVAGDDFLGLARSFYLGGALSVMNSLWPVRDEGTLYFMTEFHRHAGDGNYAAAWAQTVASAKAEGYPPSVYGAFVLGGKADR